MVEAHAQSVEDYLIEGLSYKLSPGASYVTNRRSVSFFPSGSDTYSPSSGVKVIRLKVNGTDWLDPSTCKVQFEITNNHASNSIYFLSGGHAFFSRCRILCGSQVVEDIQSYNRVCETFSILQSQNKLDNDAVESARKWYDANPDFLAATKKRTFSMKLCSGLLNQAKMLPVRYAPLEIELELVGDANEAVKTTNDDANWTISNVQLKADVVTLDNALENSYAEHLLSGKSLPINYGTYICQDQVVNGNNISVNISRAASRLKSVFLSMTGAGHSASNATNLKEFNNFWCAMLGAPDHDKEMEFQVQIGSKMFPEIPIRANAEAFSQLVKCLGVHNSAFHGVAIDTYRYKLHQQIIGIDTEKVLNAGFTGINTRAGDLMTIKAKAINPGSFGANNPIKLYSILHTDNVLEIRDGGVTVYD